MKAKYLIMVSLLLAILTIGAVSASDDLSGDVISQDDASVDELAVDEADDSAIESPENEEAVGEYQDFDDIKAGLYVNEQIDTNPETDDQVAFVQAMGDTYLDGTVSLSVDGTQYYNKVYSKDSKEIEANIAMSDLNLPDNLKTGIHSLALTYAKNGAGAKTLTASANFTFETDIDYFGTISSGETDYLRIVAAKGSSGVADLYNFDNYVEGAKIASVSIVDGSAVIPISGLAVGEHVFKLKYTVNGQAEESVMHISVRNNDPGYAATVSPQINVGQSVAITFTGPKANGNVEVYVDGKLVKQFKYTGGVASESVSGLSEGTHQVTIKYDKTNGFYSNTFNVNVVKAATAKKQTIKLTLKKVTVKKSAKKLVLQATLKINKKAVKGKKLTFKFNGKKYIAKTNKKGVAKVTIKKSVLKKLKVGKKVTYQVTYSKKTVKKTVKVKK